MQTTFYSSYTWRTYAYVESNEPLENQLAVYQTLHDTVSGSGYQDSNTSQVGQAYFHIGLEGYPFLWHVRRLFLYFNTSAIPNGAEIISAKLRFYCQALGDVAFDIVIQNGQPTYPHKPGENGDYNHANYSGNGGSINTNDLTFPDEDFNTGWNEIDLNDDGKSWINKEGFTKLAIRSSRDISSTPPATPSGASANIQNYVRIQVGRYWGATTRYPELVITYTVDGVTTELATQVGIDHAKGNGTSTGGDATERGFEVKLAFSGTLYDLIQHHIAGFEGDQDLILPFNVWEATLVKTITETGIFSAESFIDDLGRFPIAVVSDTLFAGETYDYRAYAIIDGTTYYGEWVEFTMHTYPVGEGPDDVISPGEPIADPIEDVEFEWPEIIFPPWEWPEWDLPPFEFDPSITFGPSFGAFLRGYDTKKDWETLREKCIIYQENMNEYVLTVNHNMLVIKNFVLDIITYLDGDVYPSNLVLMNSSQHLTPLYMEGISPDGFKDIINDFRFKDVSNTYDLLINFKKIVNSLNSLYESEYTTEPMSYNTGEYVDIQPTAKRMISQLEDMRKKSKEVRRLTIRNFKRIFTYV